MKRRGRDEAQRSAVLRGETGGHHGGQVIRLSSRGPKRGRAGTRGDGGQGIPPPGILRSALVPCPPSPESMVPYGEQDERFIDFLVEQAIREWRVRNSKVDE